MAKKKSSALPLFSLSHLLITVIAGLGTAVLFLVGRTETAGAFGAGNTSLLALFTPLPLFLLGLNQTMAHSSRVAVQSVAGAALIGAATVAALSAQQSHTLLEYVLLALLPTVFLTRQLLRQRSAGRKTAYYPTGLIANELTLYGALTAPVYFWMYRSNSVLGDQLHAFVQKMIGQLQESGSLPLLTPEQAEGVFNMFMPFYIGFLVVNMLLVLVSNAIVAQWILTKAGKAARPHPSMLDIRGHGYVSLGFVALVALALMMHGQMAQLCTAWAVVMLFAFAMYGLAIVHRRIAKTARSGLWLALFYLVFIALFPFPLLVVAVAGLMEPIVAPRRTTTN